MSAFEAFSLCAPTFQHVYGNDGAMSRQVMDENRATLEALDAVVGPQSEPARSPVVVDRETAKRMASLERLYAELDDAQNEQQTVTRATPAVAPPRDPDEARAGEVEPVLRVRRPADAASPPPGALAYLAYAFNVKLILKLVAFVFFFGHDAPKDRLATLVFFAVVAYVFLVRGNRTPEEDARYFGTPMDAPTNERDRDALNFSRVVRRGSVVRRVREGRQSALGDVAVLMSSFILSVVPTYAVTEEPQDAPPAPNPQR